MSAEQKLGTDMSSDETSLEKIKALKDGLKRLEGLVNRHALYLSDEEPARKEDAQLLITESHTLVTIKADIKALMNGANAFHLQSKSTAGTGRRVR
jgi:hypothetical protein